MLSQKLSTKCHGTFIIGVLFFPDLNSLVAPPNPVIIFQAGAAKRARNVKAFAAKSAVKSALRKFAGRQVSRPSPGSFDILRAFEHRQWQAVPALHRIEERRRQCEMPGEIWSAMPKSPGHDRRCQRGRAAGHSERENVSQSAR